MTDKPTGSTNNQAPLNPLRYTGKRLDSYFNLGRTLGNWRTWLANNGPS